MRPVNENLTLLNLGKTLVSQRDEADRLENQITELFEAMHVPLCRYLTGLLGNRMDAEDLAQEVFLRLYDQFQQRRTVTNLRAWLFRVAHNLAIDTHRRRESAGCNLELDSDEVFPKLQDRAAGVEENLLAKERHHRLGRALSRLSPQERQCLDLRSEGLSYREIGGILGIRIATVATFLARGIQKILRELNG